MTKRKSAGFTYSDDGADVAGHITHLAHVDIKVPQLVPLCLFVDDAGPLTDSVDAAQVAGRVCSGIWRPGQRHIGGLETQCACAVAQGGGGLEADLGSAVGDAIWKGRRVGCAELRIFVLVSGASEETHGAGADD